MISGMPGPFVGTFLNVALNLQPHLMRLMITTARLRWWAWQTLTVITATTPGAPQKAPCHGILVGGVQSATP